MRVVLVSAYFRPHVGGVERSVETLADGLAARGHSVTVLCTRTERGSPLLERGAYEVVRVPATNVVERRLGVPYPLPAPLALVPALRCELRGADVVHVHDVLYPTSIAALAVAPSLAPRVVLTLHVGFVPQRAPWLERAERAAIALAGPLARRAHAAASMNDAVARWASATWGLDVAFAPAGLPAISATADRDAFGLPADAPVALFVGRDVPKKGLDHFAAARPEGWERVAVTDRVRPGLRTFRFMPPERLATLLASVDALVLPSVAEGLPMIVQEAMTLGLPVVTTLQPGYERYLDSGDVVEIEPDAHSIEAALDRLRAPEERRRLADRGRAVAAARFSLDAMLDAYEELYRPW